MANFEEPTQLDMVLTPLERAALLVNLLPRGARGVVDRACGSTPQQRYKARQRAKAKLEKMRGYAA